ncbi:hypothetical protein [Stenotrophomonas sp. S39]|uniref:hypothetical protein n=1 Tax=Stenotrophomonas sp. S39 TaxID=2767451 RepID=UPI00190C6340|nr:hypothetical protein [Stenotrophomonas sp. S39]MBK0053096.1 hypothetical protein [Stenotrophomonas sp. S39]
MPKLKQVTAADHDRLFFIRWMLLLVVANEAAGLPEVNRQRLHSLLFVSFASSKFYRIVPLRQRARRSEHGPYYRMAHIALGHLVMAGLLDVSGFRPYPEPRDLQFEGVFRPTRAGINACKHLRMTMTGDRIYRFLLDMCLASAESLASDGTQADSEVLDRTLKADLTYQRAVRKHGEILELQDPSEEETPTVRGLHSIDDHLQSVGFFNRRDVVAAYQVVLSRRAGAAA